MDYHYPERFDALARNGASFAELVFMHLAEESRENVAKIARRVKDNGIFLRSFNCMFDKSVPVTGENRDLSKIREYLTSTMEKLSCFAPFNVVLGSAGARFVPEEKREEGMKQLAEVLSEIVSPVFASYGCTCTVEPLSECPFIHTLQNGKDLCRMVNRPNIRLLADFYHVYKNGEDPLEEIDDPQIMGHIHVASLPDRTWPKPGEEEYYAKIFSILSRWHYNDCVSVEGNFGGKDFDLSVRTARKILGQYQTE
ncbi:MAG: sugar phosphate isomerase/epimerase [Clostridia bacterium]|nr:sugar phosphate isomerase/epimerase [Clostridia bacterium]